MKTLFLTLLFFPLFSGIQNTDVSVTTPEEEIEEAIIGYITNFFLNEYDEMEVFLHDRLSKRGINADGRLSPEYPKEQLKILMENKQAMPLQMQKNEVSNILVYENVATAILDTGYPNTRWKEYIHMAKIDGEWLIMDVFWDFETKMDG